MQKHSLHGINKDLCIEPLQLSRKNCIFSAYKLLIIALTTASVFTMVLTPIANATISTYKMASEQTLFHITKKSNSSQRTFSTNRSIQKSNEKQHKEPTEKSSNTFTIFEKKYTSLIKNKLFPQAIHLLYSNKINILNHITRPITPDFIILLLEHEQIKLADLFLNELQATANKFLVADMQYRLAYLAFMKNDIPKTLSLLNPVINKNTLTPEKNDHAYFMIAATLQKQKKHRQALKFYQKIQNKPNFASAVYINQSIAYTHQGWWTDATLELANIHDNQTHNTNFTDYSYLLQGYSNLKHGLYRDARQSFSKISLSSRWFDKGLLGLGLAALNQKDYIGALNAFDRLYAKGLSHGFSSLPLLESKLLIAFTHERMSQHSIASSGYSEAVKFYAEQTEKLQKFSKKILIKEISPKNRFNPDTTKINSAIEFLDMQKNTLFRLKTLEKSTYERKIKLIQYLLEHADTPKKNQTLLFKALSKQLHSAKIEIQKNINLRQDQMKSYSNQAQYAIANLYDDSKKNSNLPSSTKKESNLKPKNERDNP